MAAELKMSRDTVRKWRGRLQVSRLRAWVMRRGRVFLVSQIEEHVHEGQSNRESVVSGLVTSGRVITAAATIMVFVFGSFVLNGDPTVKQFGVGLAVAVILDATVMRCLLVPALMVMVGRANWYLPRWVDRWLPYISIEGAEFFEERDRRVAVPEVQYSGTLPS